MVMEEVFLKLRTLQEILSDKIILEKDIQEIPKLLTTQEELLARLKKTYIEKNHEYDTLRANVGQFRNMLAEAESTREKAEKNMDVINTQREYEALDKEIRDASEKEQQYRKDLQKEERSLLDMQEQLKRDTALIEQQEQELQDRRKGIEAEIAEKKSDVDLLAAKENDISPGLDQEVLFKFERIIRNKMGLGIVAIKSGVCTGCHMILPAQFANMVRSGEEIVFCPYCSRILFFEESEQGEQDFFNNDEAGSLSDLDDLDGEDEEEYEEEEEEEEEEKADMEFDN
jgi:predicted  nucleic acid-binding Zn-ribbon protein